MFERAPKVPSLDADDRVGMGVEGRVTPKDVGGDRIGFDTVGATPERFFDDISQEIAVPGGDVKIPTRNDACERASDARLVRC